MFWTSPSLVEMSNREVWTTSSLVAGVFILTARSKLILTLAFRVDLEQLVEEAIDGSWIGYCARTTALRESEIGTVYAPTLDHRSSSVLTAPASAQNVEIVVDIDRREGVGILPVFFSVFLRFVQGWTLKCDKGGIRRVLMNLFGNSLKFTSVGYVSTTRDLAYPKVIVWLRACLPTSDIHT